MPVATKRLAASKEPAKLGALETKLFRMKDNKTIGKLQVKYKTTSDMTGPTVRKSRRDEGLVELMGFLDFTK